MNTIKVFYNDKQVHDAASFSKSPLKPGMLARRIALDPAFDIYSEFGPATIERLKQVHCPDYIDGLFNGTIPDGFGNTSPAGFTAIRHTVGNFLLAAEWAVAGKRTGNPKTDIIHPGVVWSLTSGFHHAGHNFGGGFCTLDGLSLAAFELQKFRGVKSLVIDGDAHYGNGTVNIINMVGMEDYCTYMQSSHTHAHVDLSRYATELASTLQRVRPDCIMYQAGADNWLGDQMCGMLTMAEMYQRDIITLTLAKDNNVPVVVNLAGGYAHDYEHTLTIHMNTGEALKEVYLGIRGNPLFPVHAVEIEHA